MYTIVIEPCEEGGYSGFVAEVNGANSQGETLEETKNNVISSLRELIDYRREKCKNKANVTIIEYRPNTD